MDSVGRNFGKVPTDVDPRQVRPWKHERSSNELGKKVVARGSNKKQFLRYHQLR